MSLAGPVKQPRRSMKRKAIRRKMPAGNGLEQLAFSRLGYEETPDDVVEEGVTFEPEPETSQDQSQPIYQPPPSSKLSLRDPILVLGAVLFVLGLFLTFTYSPVPLYIRLLLPSGALTIFLRARYLYHLP